MTSPWRPPEAYVHGLSGPVVVVPARVAAWLERHARLRALRGEARGCDAEVANVLAALSLAAATWRTSALGSDAAPAAEVQAPSPVMGTSQVANAVGIGERAVRLAIERGDLAATQGEGRWVINREDFEHYRAGRAARR